MMQPRAEIQEN